MIGNLNLNFNTALEPRHATAHASRVHFVRGLYSDRLRCACSRRPARGGRGRSRNTVQARHVYGCVCVRSYGRIRLSYTGFTHPTLSTSTLDARPRSTSTPAATQERQDAVRSAEYDEPKDRSQQTNKNPGEGGGRNFV